MGRFSAPRVSNNMNFPYWFKNTMKTAYARLLVTGDFRACIIEILSAYDYLGSFAHRR